MMPPGIPANRKRPIYSLVCFARYTDDPLKCWLNYHVLHLDADNMVAILKGIGGGQKLNWDECD